MQASTAQSQKPVLSVENIVITYRSRGKHALTAVNNVSFTVGQGEAFGLVGESGSGKSSTGRGVIRLTPVQSGSVLYNGLNILELPARDLKKIRRDVQMIFQNPTSSLDPRMTVGETIREMFVIHRIGSRADHGTRLRSLLASVGLDESLIDRFPYQLSGGQNQRVAIGRALACDPKVLICDEPTSALDVSVQAQIINLLRDIQSARGLSLFFISHDLAVVRNICDTVGIMRDGRIVELGDTNTIFRAPTHEYTKALIRAIPSINTAGSASESRLAAKRAAESPPSPGGIDD